MKSILKSNAQFKEIFEVIENGNRNLLIHGKAGVGKSTLLRHIVENSSKSCVVLAPTGIAAIHIKGMTIHRFFQLPTVPLMVDDENIKALENSHPFHQAMLHADVIIIDEISMVRADLLDGIDCALRRNCKNNLPFGGKQMILFGDSFQLAPVVGSDDAVKNFFKDHFKSEYFMDAYAFRQANFKKFELEKVYRQSDKTFVDILNRIRLGDQTFQDISFINQKCATQFNLDVDQFAVTLCTTNKIAEQINKNAMLKIEGESILKIGQTNGKFDERNFPVPAILSIKVGAKMMILKNGINYANGSIGIVTEISDEYIKLYLESKEEAIVGKYAWGQYAYNYDKATKRIKSNQIGTYNQFPLAPAWAISIHKSQGMTFNHVKVDLGNRVFACGQTYVALSRCTHLKGLTLIRALTMSDIKIHPRVKEFFTSGNTEFSIRKAS